jgi:hypothetical protein
MIAQSGATVGVSGTRVVDKDGFIVSETGSCVVGSVAWLERQKNIEAAVSLMRRLDGV